MNLENTYRESDNSVLAATVENNVTSISKSLEDTFSEIFESGNEHADFVNRQRILTSIEKIKDLKGTLL